MNTDFFRVLPASGLVRAHPCAPWSRIFFSLFLLLAAPGWACAADGGLQAIPPFGARVTDLTGTLTAQQVQSLSDELQALEQRKGSRVAVLMLATTQPEDIAAYSIRVTDAWKLSRSDGKTQDGVLLTVAKNDHRVRIDVGRDLEGAIPDAANARIIREYVTPKFRANDYYGGIEDALGAITKLIDGETLPPPLTDESGQGDGSGDVFNAAIFAVFAMLWARGMFGRLSAPPRGGLVGLVGAGSAWLLSGGVAPLAIGLGVVGLILGLLGGGGGGFANRGGWGGFPGGFGGGGFGGGGGGGFGGGFSGGSGGGFSGGGASGSW